MPSLLEKGVRWFRDKLPDAAAVTVEIREGSEGTQVLEAVQAVPGRRDFEEYQVDEFSGTDETFDWIVAEQDLIFGGVKRQPASGWEIRYRREDGSVAVYAVRPATGTRAFDVVDQYGILYRIHTKLDHIEPPAV